MTHKKKKDSRKVIRFFTVEIADVASAPELYANPANPYTQLSEEERLKDFSKIFGLLWAESCQKTNKNNCEKNDCKN